VKKLLYLFLAITVISCSKDDDSNETNEPQSFFEKYENVVYQVPLEEMFYLGDGITFSSNPLEVKIVWIDLFEDGLSCGADSFPMDVGDYELVEDTADLLTFRYNGYLVTYEALNNGQQIEVINQTSQGTFQAIYSRTNLPNPCD